MKLYVAVAAAMMFAPIAAFAAETSATTAAPTAASPAAAAPAEAGSVGPRWTACASDVQKFCPNLERGKGKVRACLEGHTSELSDGCKSRMAEHHEKPS